MAGMMIERIARILWERSLLKPAIMDGPKAGDADWRRFEPIAREVLAAMQLSDRDTFGNLNESVITILVAGRAVLPEHDEPMQEDAANCWNAMIDAALSEKDS